MRHNVAGSYTWWGTNLFRFAAKADDPCNTNKLLWIDVLNVAQFSISSSDQVIDTTDFIYDECEVWVYLDDSYLDRAWCLAEAAKFSNPASKCVIVVSGSANFKLGTDFFSCMKAGKESDIPLIQKYAMEKYGSKERFNQIVDDAIVRLSGWSLIYQGRYGEALQACDKEIELLRRLAGDNSRSILEAQATMAVCCEKLGDFEKSLEIHQKVLEEKVLCHGTEHVNVANTYVCMGIVEKKLGNFEKAMELYVQALEIYLKCVGPSHVNVANTYCNMG
eukprot:CAMPEP_0172188064 /NCGR_PEP_ID=MMETSP1050-20130122/21698_1 /TAXON_ID=233186 /ORGANISM="Cryptomonas curvata, Strain CCAP979/52" /LENGTH=276 /DNA_ID=CAMNT_0012862481 /DNA_START=604 /DNA_END=1430 /DNA_ORIENTATION=-